MENLANVEIIMIIFIALFLGMTMGLHLGQWLKKIENEAWSVYEENEARTKMSESEKKDPVLSNVILEALEGGKKVRPICWEDDYIYMDEERELRTSSGEGTYPWAGLPTAGQRNRRRRQSWSTPDA